ncbi:hypothetical protein RHMOL_Rhmol08G0009000 [Rhododendron molle]|uniref:Uncharacterized protein n=1 Tax=Rhododendron molle TaxID=49168 RepID=A0ACC0MJR0_RHOML|nr:hypothetical protein RHMOL_Rhmol08G0009000 [Rhododendron molle]
MFDLGDELIIGSQRIPWLIWIQLLVMLLLIILLYYFTVSALGLDPSATAAAASTSTVLLASGSAAAASTSRVPNIKFYLKIKFIILNLLNWKDRNSLREKNENARGVVGQW